MNNFKDWLFSSLREWVDRDGARQFAAVLDEFTDKLEFTDTEAEHRCQDTAFAAVRELADRVALGNTP